MSSVEEPAAQWRDVLDRYRAALDAQRIVLGRPADEAGASAPAQPFEPPSQLPPVPAVLRDEAIGLAAETAELLEHARELLAGITPPAMTPAHRSVLAPPSSSQMDTRL